MSKPNEEISPTAETVYTKLTTKVKRGTGTRDQDTTKVVTRHPDPQTAGVRHQQAIETLRAAADAARTVQPGGGDGDE